MKKALKLILIFMISIGITVLTQLESTNAKDITGSMKISEIFTDQKIAEKVRDSLSKTSIDDIISQSDLNIVTALEIHDVTSFSGVQYLNNLLSLSINRIEERDLYELSNLKNLKELKLMFSTPNNLNFMEGLTSLDSLLIFGGSHGETISDYDKISTLSSLKHLSLSDSGTKNIDFISNLTELESIYIYGTEISNIPDISLLLNLKSFSSQNSNISDVSSFKEVNSIEEIIITNTMFSDKSKITDVSSLKNLPNLKKLNISGQSIYDLSVFKNGFNNLEFLNLDNQYIEEEKRYVNDNQYIINNVFKDFEGNDIEIDVNNDYNSILPHKFIYDKDNNTVKWNDLKNDTELKYHVKTKLMHNNKEVEFSGTVKIPIVRINKLISTKTEVTYKFNQSANEKQFLEDIEASIVLIDDTIEKETITSNFKDIVNFSKSGTYEVTINGIGSNGIVTNSLIISVHIQSEEKKPKKISTNKKDNIKTLPDTGLDTNIDTIISLLLLSIILISVSKKITS